MLLLILIWLLIIFPSYLAGSMIISTLRIESRNYESEFFIVSTWIGILILALLMLFISLFIPLSLSCFLLPALIISGISLSNSSVREKLRFYADKISISWLAIWISLFVSVAFIATSKVELFDVGLYHFQLIQWLSKFGTVPGLALLHSRLGFTSSWFSLVASFNLGSLSGKTVALSGGLALLMAGAHFIICLNSIFKVTRQYNNHSVNWFIIVSMLSCLPYLVRYGLAVSSSPDTPVVILTIEIAWLILFISNEINNNSQNHIFSNGKQVESNARLLPLILACGAFSIKLSSLPLLLISLIFYCFDNTRIQISLLVRGIIVGAVLTTPILLVNTVSSGCPLYPSPTFCTDLPWSVGSEQATQVSVIIRDWARWLGPTPENSSNWNWLMHWLPRSGHSLFLIITSILSSSVFLFIPRASETRGRLYIFMIALVGISFLMYKAPSTRFGLGYLMTLPSFTIALTIQSKLFLGMPLLMLFSFYNNFIIVGESWASPLDKNTINVIILVFLIIVLAILFLRNNYQRWVQIPLLTMALILSVSVPSYHYLLQGYDSKVYSRLIVPMGIHSLVYPDQFEESYAVNFKYLKPKEGDQCWDAPLPCTPYLTYSNVKLSNNQKGFGEGFSLTD